jgi:hypothetical protein
MVIISNLLIPTTFLFLKYKYLFGDEIEMVLSMQEKMLNVWFYSQCSFVIPHIRYNAGMWFGNISCP